MEIVARQNRILFEGFSLFALLAILVVVVITAFSTDSPLLFVMVGFLPSIITVVMSIIYYEESFSHKLTIWFIPFIVVASFFVIGTNYSYMGDNMDVATLTSVNIIFSVLYLGIFFSLIQISKTPRPAPQRKVVVVEKPEINIQEYIASIEEKSKALNFVIGRTYNKYHGGSLELRKSINLKPEWYNELSEALQNEDKADKLRLFMIIENIEKHLANLKKKENVVFSKKQLESLKNLDRDPDGEDAILDVLMKNDADPVELYYKGMEEFCETIRKELEEKTEEKMKGSVNKK